MGVANNDTFTLQDVVDEINASSDDLVECFLDAITIKFDSNYNPNSDGTDNNLLNFRNYNPANTLTVETSSVGYNPTTIFAYVSNKSVDDQDITFTWKYVSNSYSNVEPTVKLGSSTGASVSVGYTTGSITGNLSEATSDGAFFPRETFYVYYYGSDDNVTFEFTLTSAEIDTVPSSPDNKTDVDVSFNQ